MEEEMLFRDKHGLPEWRMQCKEPAIRHRVLHIDLKGPKIPVEIFAHLLETLARWGINGVLVEYEHRIPQLPLSYQFPSYDRYTEKELGDLMVLAQQLGIEWIPLIQTFGHVEYLSRLKGTRELFENPVWANQLCPSKPETRQYLSKLIKYVCQIHPQSMRIHVGQDETHQLGSCPACKKRMDKLGGRMELYLDHAKWVWNEVFASGRIPMFWGDMLLGEGRIDLIAGIDERVIPLPWEYGTTGKTGRFVIYKGFRPVKAQFRNPYREGFLPYGPVKSGHYVEDLPAEDLEKIGGLDSETGYPRDCPQLRVMAKTGRPLWGTCAAYMSADMPFHANYIRGFLNPNQMAETLVELGGEGIIATMWARGHSFAPMNAPWTLVLFNIAQFAASSWTGKTSPEDLRKRAGGIASELDMPQKFEDGWILDDILWMVSGSNYAAGSGAKLSTIPFVLDILKKAGVSGCFGEGLKLALAGEHIQNKLRFIQEECKWWYPTRKEMPAVLRNDMKKRLREALVEAQKLRGPFQRYYLKWVGDRKSFNVWWKGLFDLDSRISKDIVRLF